MSEAPAPVAAAFVAENRVAPLRDAVLRLVAAKGRDMSIRVLAVLLEMEGECTPRMIQDRTGLPKPAITRACDVLVIRKFIARQASPVDRRRVHMHRTAAGNRFIASLVKGKVS